MNSLSWFFYLANVLPAISSFLFAVGFSLSVGIALYVVAYKSPDHPFQGLLTGLFPFPYKLCSVPLVFFLFSILIPQEKTIYMIAASEMGETVVQSEEAKELYDDLKGIIKGYLKEES